MDEKARLESDSLRRHRRQVLWQILLPAIVAGVLISAAAVLTALGKAGATSLWRDVALIWLLAPALLLILVGIVVLVMAIYGMSRLMRAAPRYTGRAQELTRQGAEFIQKAADATTKPVLWLEQAGAGLRSILNRGRRTNSTRKEG